MKLPPSRGGRTPAPDKLDLIHAEVYRQNIVAARNILDHPEVYPKESGMRIWAQLIMDRFNKL